MPGGSVGPERPPAPPPNHSSNRSRGGGAAQAEYGQPIASEGIANDLAQGGARLLTVWEVVVIA